MSRIKSTRRVVLSGDQGDSIYLARIAELEAQVQALTEELERYRALTGSGMNTRLATGAEPGILHPGGQQPAPPSLVNADGTQGMRRGVSGGRTRSSQDIEDKS